MSNETSQETQIHFWSPYYVLREDADYSVSIKAPEEGNNERRARNQSAVRTRAGNTFVYDRGTDFNTVIVLEFKEIPDADRASLVVFLDAIQWATTKVKYQDMYGKQYVVRILQESNNGIIYVDNGLNVKRGRSFIRWNFNLELLNISDNYAELEAADEAVSSALALHIKDYDSPHNPEVLTNLSSGVAATLEAFLTNKWRSIIWVVCAEKIADGLSITATVTANHNWEAIDDIADDTEMTLDPMNSLGDCLSHLTFAVDLDGTGSEQVMRLRCTANEAGWRIKVRRLKMGQLS